MKPVLLVDVDGVLNISGPIAEAVRLGDGRVVCLVPKAREFVAALAEVYDLVWCTAWEHAANEGLAQALGLEPLPVVEAKPGNRHILDWKVWAVRRMFRGFKGPIAWVEDGFPPSDRLWAASRRYPTLLVGVDPRWGLTEWHVLRLLAWAKAVQRESPGCP